MGHQNLLHDENKHIDILRFRGGGSYLILI